MSVIRSLGKEGQALEPYYLWQKFHDMLSITCLAREIPDQLQAGSTDQHNGEIGGQKLTCVDSP